LRNAVAARSNRDFAEAPRRGRARVVEMEDEETWGSRVFGFVRSHPLEIAVAALLVSAGGAITWNALVLQTGHHPAPFFARGTIGPAPMPPARPFVEAFEPAALTLPPAPTMTGTTNPNPAPVATPQRPTPRDSIGEAIRISEPPPLPVARPTTTASVRPAPQVSQPVPQPTRTTIGDLIRFGDAPPIPPGYVAKVEPVRLVASGQRALAKLGYGPLKADGIMGPGTRQLLERFERDRRLPVTGDFTPRTVRELSVASGISVE
jgi:Putative peptidoglycan binding domain